MIYVASSSDGEDDKVDSKLLKKLERVMERLQTLRKFDKL